MSFRSTNLLPKTNTLPKITQQSLKIEKNMHRFGILRNLEFYMMGFSHRFLATLMGQTFPLVVKNKCSH
jgi:hypothetical protein